MARSSRASRRIAGALALTAAVAAAVEVSAHRRDEYLQAARVAIDPGVVQIELDLSPGIALADAIVADIDRDRDGMWSADEQRNYATLVLSGLHLRIDSTPVRMQVERFSFPDAGAMRRGEGTIRLDTRAALPGLSNGAHHLSFGNTYHQDGSVYLANALVPGSDRIAVTAQHRDGGQRELTIDYVMTPAATPPAVWVFLIVGAAAALSLARLFTRRRSAPRPSSRLSTQL